MLFFLALFFVLNGGLWAWFNITQKENLRKQIKKELEFEFSSKIPAITPKPLLSYTFDNLAKRSYVRSEIKTGEELTFYSGEKYEAKLFEFLSDGKKVTGQINIPMTPMSNKMPVIIMLRGYVDREIYETGIGTNKVAGMLASEGYVTLAPDFLGYGGSDMPENDVWWERFSNPVVVLNLIASLDSLGFVDSSKIGIWAHSNGGQIALSVLEIMGKDYPTTLWAPVTKPFPYSILYYTDEFEDYGKVLRIEIARLERDYDVQEFSIENYFDRIQAPIQIHQGTSDDAVPVEWSNEFVAEMKELDKEIEYFVWEGADHNMLGSWNEVVAKDLEFFAKELKEN